MRAVWIRVALAVGLAVALAAACSADPVAVGDRVEAPSVIAEATGSQAEPSAESASGEDDAPVESSGEGSEPEETGDGGETGETDGRGGRMLATPGDESDVVADATADPAPDEPVPDEPVPAELGGGPPIATQTIAPLMNDLVREWDELNFTLFFDDGESVERVAAEVEQFTIAPDSRGFAVFRAQLTDSAVLGGVVNANGEVVEVIAVTVADTDADVAVARTTLELAAERLGLEAELAGVVEEVARGAMGERTTLGGPAGATVIERLGDTESRIVVSFALGVSAAEVQDRAAVLAQMVLGGD